MLFPNDHRSTTNQTKPKLEKYRHTYMASMFIITRNAMAAMFMTRNALFRSSKSFPSSLSLTFSHKPSRLIFASSSNNYSDWRNAAEGSSSRDSSTDNWSYDATKARHDAEDRSSEMRERARETINEGVDRTKGYAHDAKEKTKDAAGSMADRAEEGANRAREYVRETKEDAKDAAGTTAERAKEYAHDTKESTKEGAERTRKTLRNVGEKAKETVQGAWEATKDTTQKIKETVVGKDDDDDDGDDTAELRRKEAGKGYGDRKNY